MSRSNPLLRPKARSNCSLRGDPDEADRPGARQKSDGIHQALLGVARRSQKS